MTGVTSVAGTAYPSGTPEFIPRFSGVRIFCVLFVYHLAIVLSVLRYMDSDYPPFGIFKLVLIKTKIKHLFFCFFDYGTPVILLFVLFIEISLFWNIDLSTWGEHITRNNYTTDVFDN